MKTRTTISITPSLIKTAQNRNINVSKICEDALRIKTNPTKNDVPEDAIRLRCTQCLKEIEYGFLCQERNLFLCQDCQDDFNMSKCPYDKRGEHYHIRIPGFDGQNTELINKIPQKASYD